MHKLWIPRLFAGAIAFYCVSYFTMNIYVSILFTLSVGHTLLAAYYSRSRALSILNGGSSSQVTSALLLVAFAAVCIWQDSLPMYYLILVHHILNETFIGSEVGRKKIFMGSLIAFEVFLFMACTPKEFGLFFFSFNSYQLTVLLGLSYLVASYLGRNVKSCFSFITLGLVAGLTSLHYSALNIDFIILYHFLFWLIYPNLKSYERLQKIETTYWKQTAFFALLTLPFTLIIENRLSLSVHQMSWVTRAFAYFHIFTTLALSGSNPSFLVSFFKPSIFKNGDSYEKAQTKPAA